jgi:SAM-dependent methyltransferase
MNEQIIGTGLRDWFATPRGRYLLAWERIQLDLAVADIFGFHALQLGLPELDGLASNRMRHRWLANDTPAPGVKLITDFSALPFPANSLDLVLLPHALELASDPHATLREVERVLVPEGRVVICGLNPASPWGFRQHRGRGQLYHSLGFGRRSLPHQELIGYWRLRDWLRLLSFEVEVGRFGCNMPAMATEKWLQRFHWMDRAGARWWPILGAVYFLQAVKRVRGMTLLSPGWKTSRLPASVPVSIANSSSLTGASGHHETKKRNVD